MNDLVKYSTEHGEVTLSPQIIKQYLVPSGTNVTMQEVMMFLKLCEYQKLNPFLREVYLVKYGDFPASMVTGKEVFTKRASKDPNFDGLEAGITVVDPEGKVERREGSMLLPHEKLVGGWCRVALKNTKVPFFEEVSIDEYIGRKKDGTPTGMWATKPATMIRKVAIVHTLREAFPESFEGLYSQEEINTIDASRLPVEPVVVVDVSDDCQAVETSPEPPQSVAKAYVKPTATNATPGSYILQFGNKHKGKSLVQIMQDDPTYLDWVATKSNAYDDVKAAVNAYLHQTKPVVVNNATTKPVTKEVVDAFADNDTPVPFDLD